MRFTLTLILSLAVPAFASPPTPLPDTDDLIVSAVQVSASADVAAPELEQHVITTAGMELVATTQHHEEVTAMQTPTIGRIVHYRLTEADAEKINSREDSPGASRVGSRVNKGDIVPLTITKVWPEEYAQHLSDDGSSTVQAKLAHHQSPVGYESSFGVNGQATLDGNDSLWVCSAPQHATLDGCWSWPAKV